MYYGQPKYWKTEWIRSLHTVFSNFQKKKNGGPKGHYVFSADALQQVLKYQEKHFGGPEESKRSTKIFSR